MQCHVMFIKYYPEWSYSSETFTQTNWFCFQLVSLHIHFSFLPFVNFIFCCSFKRTFHFIWKNSSIKIYKVVKIYFFLYCSKIANFTLQNSISIKVVKIFHQFFFHFFVSQHTIGGEKKIIETWKSNKSLRQSMRKKGVQIELFHIF